MKKSILLGLLSSLLAACGVNQTTHNVVQTETTTNYKPVVGQFLGAVLQNDPDTMRG